MARQAERPGIGAMYIRNGAEGIDSDNIAHVDDGGLVGLDWSHYMIHEGRMFYAVVQDLDMDAAEFITISFTTGANYVHIFPSIFMTVLGTFDILEGGTVAADGAAYTVLNRNRDSATTSLVTDFTGGATANTVSLGVTGTLNTLGGAPTIFGVEGFSGTKNSQQAVAREQAEWILIPATVYTFRLTSLAADAVARITLNWYEV